MSLADIFGLPQGGFDPRLPSQRDPLYTGDSQRYRDQVAEDQRRRSGYLSELEATRDAQLADADNVFRVYRDAGLADTAARYRQGARSNAFAQARRGTTQGSADVDAQFGLIDQADAGARDADMQAEAARQSSLTGTLGQFFNAQRGFMADNPYTTEGANLAQRTIQDRTAAQRRLYGLADARDQSNDAYHRGMGDLYGGFLSGAAGGFGRTFGSRTPEAPTRPSPLAYNRGLNDPSLYEDVT